MMIDILLIDDLHHYEYPSDKSINKIGIRGIYLGNYIRWDPIEQHNLMIKKFGEKGAFQKCNDKVLS